jgi:ABC-type glutathione transport system ATPase component
VPALLEVSRLAVHYRVPAGDPVFALADATLDVAAGETVGLLGESGAGKTTLVDAVLGLLPGGAVPSGSIRFAGRELVGLSEAEHRRLRGKAIALVPQDPAVALNPVRRAGPQVAEIVAAHDGGGAGAVRARAVEALASVGLPAEVYDAYPHQLSGGQRQRVTIAQALCCRPALLLADEPTAALDSVTQAELRALLASLRARHGLAMLLVSHDVGLLLALADRVVVLAGGRTVEAGPASSVLRAPREPYTRALLSAVPRAGLVHGG